MRAALEKLCRTEDPSCLEPFLRRRDDKDIEEDIDGVIKEEIGSEASIGVPVEISGIPDTKIDTSFETKVRLT